MKRYFVIVAVALSLGGCANLGNIKTAIDVATTPVTVTPAMVYQVENGLRVAAAGLVTYRRLCIRKAIDRSCRAVIAKIQPYTRAAKTTLIELRVAVRDNNQVTAITAFKALQGLISDINSQRQLAGVN